MDALSTARSSSFDVDTTGISGASCANSLPAGTRLKNFEIVSSLGQGGFSIVYAAMDTALQRPVAVKEYMPTSFASRADSSQVILRSQRHKTSFDAGLNSFIEEARLLAQFKHSALVEVLSFWEENGTAYMAMPLYSGKTLRQTLRDHPGCVSEAWLKTLIAPVLDVLELLHGQQIYHRDIAPDNIIIQSNGKPVLLDLGSARKVASDSDHAPTVVVKPGYAPIEQYAEDKSVPQGPWTDIYALGALLYYTLTGRAPTASVSRMMKDSLSLLSEQSLPGYSRDFLAAIDHALALQPAERPQSISEFRTALDINNLAKSPASMAAPSVAHETPEYLDEEKTVILSTEELGLLLNGGPVPKTATPPPDSYNNLFEPEPQRATETHSFADMEEFLNPPTPESLGTISVPRNHTQPSSAPAPTMPASPRRRHRGLLVTGGIGGGVLIASLLTAAVLFSNDDEASVEVPVQTEVAIAQPLFSPPPVAEHVWTDQPSDQAAGANTDFEFFFGAPLQSASTDLANNGAIDESAPDSSSLLQPADIQQPVNTSLVAPTASAENRPQTAMEQPPTALSDNTLRAVSVPTPAQPETAERVQQIRRSDSAQPAANPARTNTAVAATGRVELNVLPWGEVWVDGTLMGITPPLRELQLPAGRHTVEIRNPGFASLSHSIEVGNGNTPRIAHEFISSGSNGSRSLNQPESNRSATAVAQPSQRPAEQARPATQPARPAGPTLYGYTDIRVRPWAEVWVNGELKGVSPPLNELRLPEGLHNIEFRNPNYPTVRRSVNISGAQRSTLVQSFD